MGFLSLFISAVYIVKINNYKRMLAYSSIENIGIIAIGIGIGGAAIFAALLHLIAHSLIKASLFLTSGNILRRFGTRKVNEVGGYLNKEPLSAWIWIFSFTAIAGIPPFPIFLSEFIIVKETLRNGQIILLIPFFLLLTIIIAGIGIIVFRISWPRGNGALNSKISEEIIPTKTTVFLTSLPQIIFLLILLIMGVGLPDLIKNIISNAVTGVF